MMFDNKSLLIIGLIVGGLACIYMNNTELASAIFGGLVGYLSHGVSGSVDGVGTGADGVGTGAGTGADSVSGSDEVIE